MHHHQLFASNIDEVLGQLSVTTGAGRVETCPSVLKAVKAWVRERTVFTYIHAYIQRKTQRESSLYIHTYIHTYRDRERERAVFEYIHTERERERTVFITHRLNNEHHR